MVAYTSEGVFVHDTALDEWQHHPVPATTPGYPSTGSSAPPTTRRPV
jgi:hypothetical protein